jgi:two-component system nitrogen regulation response regulator GlnG/two-component system response regulator HydG
MKASMWNRQAPGDESDERPRQKRTTVLPAPEQDNGNVVREVPSLTIVWSAHEGHRTGESVVLGAGDDDDDEEHGRTAYCLGRCDTHPTDTALAFGRMRPFARNEIGPLESLGVSRVQWRMRRVDDAIEVVNVGRRQLLHNGTPTSVALAVPGDLLEIEGETLFLVGTHAHAPAATHSWDERMIAGWRFAFGAADAFGFVGESARAWELRRQIAFAAVRPDNVLIIGPSGSGKELAAQAVHTLSSRGKKALVARNAATLPESIIDAELFGNVRDFPNVGTPERAGLVGAAEGSTLFLDEIGEISFALQAHLLRVLDLNEYQKLGDPRPRIANVRVIAATNRAATELKHDLAPRLRMRLTVPGLDERRADIPLIARRLLENIAGDDPQLRHRCFRDGDAAEPRWTAGFVGALVRHRYTTHVRELETLLLATVAASKDGTLDRPSRLAQIQLAQGTGSMQRLSAPSSTSSPSSPSVDPRTISATQLRDALSASEGSRERTWRALGLRNRHQLMRLLRKYKGEVASELLDDDDDITQPESE